jgi:epoxyqueuosine reductase QueG
MDLNGFKEKLRSISDRKGGRLFGVCRIDDLIETFHFEIKKSAKKLNTAISIGVPVSKGVLNALIDRPNILYKTHYRQINHILNDIAFSIGSEINNSGYKSIPIPASQIIKWKPMTAHLSHRVMAHKAGLGWRGKNNLLVNQKYGSQIRLVTVLTDLELEIDNPVEMDCGDCVACIKACPVGAIKNDPEDFDLQKCFEIISEFARPENIGTYICGLCLKPCPGNKKSPGKDKDLK